MSKLVCLECGVLMSSHSDAQTWSRYNYARNTEEDNWFGGSFKSFSLMLWRCPRCKTILLELELEDEKKSFNDMMIGRKKEYIKIRDKVFYAKNTESKI